MRADDKAKRANNSKTFKDSDRTPEHPGLDFVLTIGAFALVGS